LIASASWTLIADTAQDAKRANLAGELEFGAARLVEGFNLLPSHRGERETGV
jgi:hypothetical protein